MVKTISKFFSENHLNNHPNISKAPVCVRFHTKGFCFNNYANKNTYTSSQDPLVSIKK